MKISCKYIGKPKLSKSAKVAQGVTGQRLYFAGDFVFNVTFSDQMKKGTSICDRNFSKSIRHRVGVTLQILDSSNCVGV